MLNYGHTIGANLIIMKQYDYTISQMETLSQMDGNGNRRLIGVASRCLAKAEINYNTTEKELLAVVYVINKFRSYLVGTTFKIFTDDKSLTFLRSTSFLSSRLARWSLLLQQYSFTIEHCRGKDNVIADFLRRNPEGKFSSYDPDRLCISRIVREVDRSNIRDWEKDVLTQYEELIENIGRLQLEDVRVLNYDVLCIK